VEFITVLRLEHTGCEDEHSKHHGPHIGAGCVSRRPNFGSVGLGPYEIYPHECCGVTYDQLPAWWSYGLEEDRVEGWDADGWNFVLYSVPTEEAREDNSQIVFVARPEYRIGLVNWDYIPDVDEERADYDWHYDQSQIRRAA
jgi:hypothetical protein